MTDEQEILKLALELAEWKARAEKAEVELHELTEPISDAGHTVADALRHEISQWQARAEKAEAQRDDWKAMHRHAQQTIADLNGDLKGQRARAEKAEAEVARLADERASPAPTRKVLWTWML